LGASLRLYESLGTHPETQLLFENIIRYTASADFNPEASVADEQFMKLLKDQIIIQS
jgi:hypothetical protein